MCGSLLPKAAGGVCARSDAQSEASRAVRFTPALHPHTNVPFTHPCPQFVTEFFKDFLATDTVEVSWHR